MVDPERALAIVRELGHAGVGVSLDDFGTGYSSLGLLKQLAVDELKIDRSFVDNALHDTSDAAIAEAVAGLGRRLGMRVVAEGVEDQATLRAVADWGATFAQGFYISRPLPAEDLTTMLTTSSTTPTPWATSPERARRSAIAGPPHTSPNGLPSARPERTCTPAASPGALGRQRSQQQGRHRADSCSSSRLSHKPGEP